MIKNPGFSHRGGSNACVGHRREHGNFFRGQRGAASASRLLRIPPRSSTWWAKLDKQGIPRLWFSEPEYWDLRDRNQGFSEIGAYSLEGGANLTSKRCPRRCKFPLLLPPHLHSRFWRSDGARRTFTADEDQPATAVKRFSALRFGTACLAATRRSSASPSNSIGERYAIVGVLRKDLSLGGKHDLWIPLASIGPSRRIGGSHYLHVTARLKPGVTQGQVSAEMDRFAAQLQRENPTSYLAERRLGHVVVPLKDEIVGSIRPRASRSLGCGGVRSPDCVRQRGKSSSGPSFSPRKELSIRTAMGAGRARIVRQFLTERYGSRDCGRRARSVPGLLGRLRPSPPGP